MIESLTYIDVVNQPIITSCQRGITACILDVALRLIGNNQTSVYDGSYEEFSRKLVLEKPPSKL